jgi:hypothetical protein
MSDAASAPPEPPDDIDDRALPLAWLARGTILRRIHRAGRAPIWFGREGVGAPLPPPTSRFDDPLRRFGVLYAAATRDGAFAETVGRNPNVFRSDTELAGLMVGDLELTRELRVVALHTGEARGALGATGDIGVGPHRVARRWARALHDQPRRPDGIRYRCRHNSDELAYAFFERIGAGALRVVASSTLTHDRDWLLAMRRRHAIFAPP